MKNTVLLTLIFLSICVTSVAQCNSLKEIVRKYKKEKYQSQASQATTKAAITYVLKKMIGSSASIVTGIFDPTTVATPYDVFLSSLIRLEKLSKEEDIDWPAYEKELENLRIAGEGVRVERLFADNAECYENIDFIIQNFQAVSNTVKRLS